MKLYHISLSTENLKALSPQIPDNLSPEEDSSQVRICLAPSIKQCIKAIDYSRFEEGQQILVYSFDIDSSDKNLLNWKQIYNFGYVNDSPLTHEYWYLKPLPIYEYEKYKISNISTKKFFQISHSYKDKIIDAILFTEKQMPIDLQEKTAVEILNLYIDNPHIDEIKNLLVHEEPNPDAISDERLQKIFPTSPCNDSFISTPDYVIATYINDCTITKI